MYDPLPSSASASNMRCCYFLVIVALVFILALVSPSTSTVIHPSEPPIKISAIAHANKSLATSQNTTRTSALFGNIVRQWFSNITDVLYKEVLGLISFQAALGIPESAIESQYLRFIKRGKRSSEISTWRKKLGGMVQHAYSTVLGAFESPTIEKTTSIFVNKTQDSKHQPGSKNHTDRVGIHREKLKNQMNRTRVAQIKPNNNTVFEDTYRFHSTNYTSPASKNRTIQKKSVLKSTDKVTSGKNTQLYPTTQTTRVKIHQLGSENKAILAEKRKINSQNESILTKTRATGSANLSRNYTFRAWMPQFHSKNNTTQNEGVFKSIVKAASGKNTRLNPKYQTAGIKYHQLGSKNKTTPVERKKPNSQNETILAETRTTDLENHTVLRTSMHEFGSRNHTVRAEMTGDSLGEDDTVFQEMPQNAEDLIQGFTTNVEVGHELISQEGAAVQENDQGEGDSESVDVEGEEIKVIEPPQQGLQQAAEMSEAGTAIEGPMFEGIPHGEGSKSDSRIEMMQHFTRSESKEGGEGLPPSFDNNPEQTGTNPVQNAQNALTTAWTEQSQVNIEDHEGDTDDLIEGEYYEPPEAFEGSEEEKGPSSDGGEQDVAPPTLLREKANAGQSNMKAVLSRKYSGSTHGMVNGLNLTQLSLMAYKIARTEKIYSMAAAPCREVSLWMPEVVVRLELELHGFQFYCVDMNEPPTAMADLKNAFGDISGGYIHSSPDEIEANIPKKLDLVVSWMGMQKWGIRKSWRFIKGLRRSGARTVLLSNNPLSGNGDPSMQTINIRKSPLLFNEPQRVIGKVSSDDNTQLLLYAMDGLRDGF